MKRKLLKTFILGISVLINTTINAQIINTIAGNTVAGYSGDGGFATSAKLNSPHGIAVDKLGNIYISDYYNHVVRKVNALGIISTFAGNTVAGYSGDGGNATSAKLNYPTDIAIDKFGNVYIADKNNSVIRKINTSGIISTFAGNNLVGYSGDGGGASSAKLYYPSGVAVDTLGNIYIADNYNHTIRKVNTSGIISTIAGNTVAGYSGDGGFASSAQLNYPWGVAVDAIGNVYIADKSNNVIRKINTSGIISTIAGNTVAGYSGDGGNATSAKLNVPYFIAIDAAGNIYITDAFNMVIRKINTLGIISTFAGNTVAGYMGDGGNATSANLDHPHGIAMDTTGNVFIADSFNNVIRKVNKDVGVGINELTSSLQINVYPNPNNGIFSISNEVKISEIILMNMLGEKIYSSQINSDKANINLKNIPKGIYFIQIVSETNRITNKKIIIE